MSLRSCLWGGYVVGLSETQDEREDNGGTAPNNQSEKAISEFYKGSFPQLNGYYDHLQSKWGVAWEKFEGPWLLRQKKKKEFKEERILNISPNSRISK